MLALSKDEILVGLPAWLPWAHVGVRLVIAFVVSWIVAALAQRIIVKPLTSAQPTHWAERARLLYPVRRVMNFSGFFLPFFIGYWAFLPTTAELVSQHALVPLVVVASYLGVRRAHRRSRAMLDLPAHSLLARLKSVIATLLILYPVILVAVPFMIMMPKTLSASGAIWSGLLALSVFACIRGIGVKLAAALGLARAPRPDVTEMLDQLARDMGQAKVRCFELAMLHANAFAMPQIRVVGITKGLVDALPLPEIRAICAHELGHIAEKKHVVRARVALIWAVYGVFVASYVTSALKLSTLVQVAIIASLFILKLSFIGRALRSAEKDADDHAHAHEGEAGVYARALEKLYMANKIPAVMAGAGQSHPHLYDRMVASGVTPDFPRPAPPPTRRVWTADLAAMLATFVLAASVEVSAVGAFAAQKNRAAALAGVVISGLRSGNVADLAHAAYAEKDFASAARFYGRLTRLESASATDHLNAALSLARANRCAEAQQTLQAASELITSQNEGSKGVDADWYESVQYTVFACEISESEGEVGH